MGRRIRALPLRLTILAAAVVAGGCLGSFRVAKTPAATPEFRPETFFAGRTLGEGVILKRFGKDRSFQVSGAGHMESDGTFVLVQTVTYEAGERAERRVFRMRPVDERRYAGTLTGASGTVEAHIDGNAFHVRYPMKRGLTMKQTIYLQPDGRTALNRATVRFLGLPVARISETITKQP